MKWTNLLPKEKKLLRLCKKMHRSVKKDSTKWEFKRWKITATLITPLFAPEPIYLDGLIYHEILRYYLGPWYYNLSDQQIVNLQNLRLPIQKSKKYGVYLASYGNYTGNNFISNFRKRLDEIPSVDWCKQPKGLIRTNMGKYKNVDSPMILNNCKEISWVVIGDRNYLLKLLKNIQSIGKKKSQGMGLVGNWIIEKPAQNYKGTRCFPIIDKNIEPNGFGRVKYSYHDLRDQTYWFWKKF